KPLLTGRCCIGTPRSVFALPGLKVTVLGGGKVTPPTLFWAFVKLATVTKHRPPMTRATQWPGRKRIRFNMVAPGMGDSRWPRHQPPRPTGTSAMAAHSAQSGRLRRAGVRRASHALKD